MIVTAYTGSSLADLRCQYDGTFAPGPDGINQPAVFRVNGGGTYFFQAGSLSYPAETGSLTLTLTQGTAPPNDLYPGMEITDLPFTHTVDTTFATVGPDEPGGGYIYGATVWYNYAPAEDGALVADSADSGYGAIICAEILTDAPDPHPDQLGCNCPALGQNDVAIQAAASQTVYFRVGGEGSPGETGTLVFNLVEPPGGATAETTPPCGESAPAPSLTVPLPAGGGAPPSRGDGLPWAAALGGALAVLASGALLVRVRRR